MPAPHYDYRKALSAWQQRPANDNTPISAESFVDLAARRVYVQRPQRKPNPVLNLPQLERLGRVAPDVARLWKFWRDLQSASAPDVFALPEIVVDDGEEPPNTGFCETELDLEIRPRVEELQRAWESAPARRVSVVCTVRSGQRFDVQPVIDPVVYREGNTGRIGDLVFRNGKLVQYGRTERGVALKPIDRLGEPKGSRKPPPTRDFRFLVRTEYTPAVEKHAVLRYNLEAFRLYSDVARHSGRLVRRLRPARFALPRHIGAPCPALLTTTSRVRGGIPLCTPAGFAALMRRGIWESVRPTSTSR
jgi:hypothetical protein